MINIILIIVIIALVYIWWNRRAQEKSLYDRLGGVYAIAAVVNHFSDALIENPIVGKNSQNPALRDWHTNQLARLPGLKFMRTLWVCAVSGGPFKYSPTVPGKCPFSLENAHAKFKISSEEFDAVAVELSKSLDHFNVPAKEKSEVLAAFAAHKPEINGKSPKCPFSLFSWFN
jgi:hemoglobin